MSRLCSLSIQLLLLPECLMVLKVHSVMCFIAGYLHIKPFVVSQQLYVDSRELMIAIILRARIVLLILVDVTCEFLWSLNELHGFAKSLQRRHTFLEGIQNIHIHFSNVSLNIFPPLRYSISFRDELIINFKDSHSLVTAAFLK